MAPGHTTRFYIETLPTEGIVKMPKEASRHAKALRLKDGDLIQVFDGTTEYTARLLTNHELEIVAKSEHTSHSGAQVTLAIAFPKGPRVDWLVEKATELGVHEIIPLITKRTVVNPRDTKVERLQKLAITACEQCGRSTIPKISLPIAVDKLLARTNEFDACFVADGSGNKLSLSKSAKKILALIGPEGGFSDEEITKAKSTGCHIISLGTTTLRTETAGLTILAQLNALL